jgi:hypothetical protein
MQKKKKRVPKIWILLSDPEYLGTESEAALSRYYPYPFWV